MDEKTIWQTKLAARVHDPIEKALVLLRDPAGHAGGTSRVLRRLLALDAATGADDPAPADDKADSMRQLLFDRALPVDVDRTVRRADWWAAAADRPQWPLQEVTTASGRVLAVAPWAQVRWTRSPVLIHPLSGTQFDLADHGGLADTELADIKDRSLRHFANLIVRDAQGQVDWQRTLLAYWRFGPDLREEDDNGKLGALWRLLPADTRVPDHSIWDHLDLTSAFAGAFAGDSDGEAALLALALGPVQPFIAAARSTSDLWAGSHLLARLAWEAMRVVCEQLGPDAILFPRLRGVPQVDCWLRDECDLPADWFADCEWANGGSDDNPLFVAALPNRFVAVVPRARAAALARAIEARVRDWLQGIGREVCDRLLEAAGYGNGGDAHCHGQMREQLAGFPEVHWAAVPFSLIRPRNTARQTDLDTSALSAAMAPFFGVADDEPGGFLRSPAWQVLKQDVAWDDGTAFFAPNPGVLYPAVYDLAERVLAAAKTVRPFAQTSQQGWRCSLTGETEWLTTDPAQLLRSYRQQTDTLWVRVARCKPAWGKAGEHLGALPAIKRLWPTLFAEEVGEAVGKQVNRFVVSTHTMALAHQLDQWLEAGAHLSAGARQALEQAGAATVALPRRLLRRHRDAGRAIADAKRLAGLLERAAELDDADAAERLRRVVKETLVPGNGRLETYYGLLLFDGDRLGAWLSDQPPHALTYRAGFHPQVRDVFDRRARDNPRLAAYAASVRALSPGRHLAISGALNDFALTLVREVIESEHLGRVLYAGGDDVLAMLPVADLLPAAQRLRLAYSGHDPAQVAGARSGLVLRGGFALLRGRLLRLMGERASASAGAVIAHHQAPLTAVLRELRAAEQRAKADFGTGGGGRDAFSLTLIKRSGGSLQFTAKWGEPMAVLLALRDFLAEPSVSRRAVYHSLQWLKDLPEPTGDGAMLAHLLGYQLGRQTESRSAILYHDVQGLARRLTALALARPDDRLGWLGNCLSVAEFLARAGRSPASSIASLPDRSAA